MAITHTIRDYLQHNQASFATLSHANSRSLEQSAKAGNVAPENVVRGVLLEDAQGVLLAVLPLSHMIDFQVLETVTGRRLTPSGDTVRKQVFADCDAGSTPPFGTAYDVEMVLDERLSKLQTVYLEAGCQSSLICLHQESFRRLMQQATVAAISRPLSGLEGILQLPEGDIILHNLTPQDAAKQRIEGLYSLPPMPDMGRRILHLSNNPDVTVEELSAIVSLDPSLSAQVIRYARSPLFGYRGSIESIHDAVARVLGLEVVMNMLLGLVVGRSLRNPPDGPLGMDTFWRDAIYTAAICQALARRIPADRRIRPGMAYLAGLLHDFGVLLLGHLFPADFYLLNKLAAANPDVPLSRLEGQVLGAGDTDSVLTTGHAEIGAWLMQAWNMPEEVVVAVREHHQPSAEGEYSVFAKLIYVANVLLKPHGMGDADSEQLPPRMLAELGLDEERANSVAEQVFENGDALDDIMNLITS